jgi:5'(3')-deoxyribonucleotidase
MRSIALDVDGVIANCVGPVHAAAESILGRELPPPSEWNNFDFEVSMHMTPEETEFFHAAMLSDDNIGWKIDLYEGAESFVDKLSRKADVFFVTAAWRGMKHWHAARENLLGRYFPALDVVFAHAKWRVNYDKILDDKAATIHAVGSRGVLFNRPWNENAVGVVRVYDYEEALDVLLKEAK